MTHPSILTPTFKNDSGVPPQTLLTLCGYTLCAFFYNLVDEMVPIFASAPLRVKGLALTTTQLAIPLAFGGSSIILWSLFGYPHLRAALGTKNTCRTGLLGSTCMVLLIALPSVVAPGHAGISIVRTMLGELSGSVAVWGSSKLGWGVCGCLSRNLCVGLCEGWGSGGGGFEGILGSHFHLQPCASAYLSAFYHAGNFTWRGDGSCRLRDGEGRSGLGGA